MYAATRSPGFTPIARSAAAIADDLRSSSAQDTSDGPRDLRAGDDRRRDPERVQEGMLGVG